MEDDKSGSEHKSDSGSKRESERESESMSDNIAPEMVSSSNLSAQEFPLLNSLGIHSEKYMDALIREVVRFNARSKITFLQANNWTGFLLPLASAWTTNRYLVEFGKFGNIIQKIVNIISQSAQCSQEEAAMCLITATFNKSEEEFISVAVEKGVMPNI